MNCPHCLVEFHSEVEWTNLRSDEEGCWAIEKYTCPSPACGKFIIFLVQGDAVWSRPAGGGTGFLHLSPVNKRFLIYPKGSSHHPVPLEVPPAFAEDYKEACLVLPDSPKASAALSRRNLQHILREVSKVKPADLFNEIQEVIDSKTLPTYISETLDAVRVIGNFAAHPMKSQQTGEIIDVEVGEAEQNLDALESLFDFYFVQPVRAAAKKAAINQKLQDAGKPPLK